MNVVVHILAYIQRVLLEDTTRCVSFQLVVLAADVLTDL